MKKKFFFRKRKLMSKLDLFSQLIKDLQGQVLLYINPNIFRENTYLDVFLAKDAFRKYYFEMHYMVPRRDGAKIYEMDINEFLLILNQMKDLGLLRPIHQNIPDPEIFINNHPNDDFYSRKEKFYDDFGTNHFNYNRNSKDYLYKYVMEYVITKYISVENFDPPRYGDYILIEKIDMYILFVQNNIHNIPEFPMEFATKIPDEIVMGINLPFNYYRNMKSYICKMNIVNIKTDILNNIVMAKYNDILFEKYAINAINETNGDVSFISYMFTDIKEITKNFPVESIQEADSSLITINNNNVRIGLSNYGFIDCDNINDPPTESFTEIIKNNDQIYVFIVVSNNERNKYDYSIEIISNETMQEYLTEDD